MRELNFWAVLSKYPWIQGRLRQESSKAHFLVIQINNLEFVDTHLSVSIILVKIKLKECLLPLQHMKNIKSSIHSIEVNIYINWNIICCFVLSDWLEKVLFSSASLIKLIVTCTFYTEVEIWFYEKCYWTYEIKCG